MIHISGKFRNNRKFHVICETKEIAQRRYDDLLPRSRVIVVTLIGRDKVARKITF